MALCGAIEGGNDSPADKVTQGKRSLTDELAFFADVVASVCRF